MTRPLRRKSTPFNGVSRRIHDVFDNGRDYYRLHGRTIEVPRRRDNQPSPELLA